MMIIILSSSIDFNVAMFQIYRTKDEFQIIGFKLKNLLNIS